MFKAMIFLQRKDDVSAAAFREWWLGRHRALAERLPGLQRHALNLLPEGAPYTAVVEQWFDTEQNLRDCYDSPAGQAVVADSSPMVKARLRVAVEAESFIVDLDQAVTS